ncbi:Ankyrin-3 [Orbilia brochopaga]|nr:Ankyrin-3 [Drechslerella brochopaga]
MDESEKIDQRDQMLSLLRHMHSKTSQCLIKTVLASRPDPDIRQKLTKYPRMILEEKNRDDIRRFIDRKMYILQQVYGSSNEEGEGMLKNVRKHLVGNAQGVFLWVELVSRELEAVFRRGITFKDLQDTLTNLPDDLEPFYKHIIQRLKDEEPKSIPEAKRMFLWVALAQRPLTLEEFREAIAVPASIEGNFVIEMEKERLKRIQDVQLRLHHNCGDLLEVNLKTGLGTRAQAQDTIQLLHRTVRDFFLHPDKIAAPFDIEESQGSFDIALACIRYLKMSMENVAATPLSEWSDHDYHNFIQHLSSWPLLPYIIRFLPRHLEHAKTHMSRAKAFVISFVEHLKRNVEHPALSLLELWLDNLGLEGYDHRHNQDAAAFRTKCLEIAASSGNLNATMVILDAEFLGASAEDGNFGSVLYSAALRGHANVVQLFLDKGVNINAKRDSGSVLQVASFTGKLDVVSLLLTKGADVNTRGGKYDNALQAAAVGGHPDVIQLLLDNGADINAYGENYDNVLQAAVSGGRVDILELLIDSGADIYTQGRSALKAASALGHLEIVELLLHMGVLVNGEDGEFLDNLIAAASAAGHLDVVQYLLAKRPSIAL